MEPTNQQTEIIQPPVPENNGLKTQNPPSTGPKRKFVIVGIVIVFLLIITAGLLIWFNKSYKKASTIPSQSTPQNASCTRSKTYTLKPETKAKIDESNRLISEAMLLASKTKSNSDPNAQNIFNDMQQSINDARDAVVLEPKNPLTWEQQGEIYETLIGVGKNSESFAISSYQQALALDAHDCPALMGLGNVYTLNKNYELAIESYKSVTQFYPNYVDAHASLAAVYQLTNQQTETKKELDIVQKLSGDNKNPQSYPLKF